MSITSYKLFYMAGRVLGAVVLFFLLLFMFGLILFGAEALAKRIAGGINDKAKRRG